MAKVMADTNVCCSLMGIILSSLTTPNLSSFHSTACYHNSINFLYRQYHPGITNVAVFFLYLNKCNVHRRSLGVSNYFSILTVLTFASYQNSVAKVYYFSVIGNN